MSDKLDKMAEELAFLRSVLGAHIRLRGPVVLSRRDLQVAMDSPGELLVEWGDDELRVVEVGPGREGAVH